MEMIEEIEPIETYNRIKLFCNDCESTEEYNVKTKPQIGYNVTLKRMFYVDTDKDYYCECGSNNVKLKYTNYDI